MCRCGVVSGVTTWPWPVINTLTDVSVHGAEMVRLETPKCLSTACWTVPACNFSIALIRSTDVNLDVIALLTASVWIADDVAIHPHTHTPAPHPHTPPPQSPHPKQKTTEKTPELLWGLLFLLLLLLLFVCVCFSTNVDNRNVYANRACFQVFLHHHSLHLLDSVEKNPITLIVPNTKFFGFFYLFL